MVPANPTAVFFSSSIKEIAFGQRVSKSDESCQSSACDADIFSALV